MYVTVIIPTYKDWQRLILCLEALGNQSYPSNLFEVVIVNNAPGDKIPSYLILQKNWKLIEEEKPGSYAARNAALRIAKGTLVGFTDSDCIPDHDWIKNAVEIFKQDISVHRLAGSVNIFYQKKKATWIELYDRVYGFNQEQNSKKGLSVTANMFTYRESFSLVGLFNEETMSGGDFEWAKRAQEKGLFIKFAPNVNVSHPARNTLKLLFQKAKRVGKGQVVLYPEKKKAKEKILGIVKTLRPKTWEIKRVFSVGEEIKFIDKVSVIILRHLLIWTSDYWRTITRLKK